MVNPIQYIQGVWLNWNKIYLAQPDNLPFLFVGLPFLLLFFFLILYIRTRKRLDKTYTSRYSKLMDMKLWLGMILVYGLTAFALAKPMIAKSNLETVLGPVEVSFLVDLSLSSHLKIFGESGPTILDASKNQIQAIEPELMDVDQVSLFYFARSTHEAHPMFPLNESLRPLFNKAVADIRLPKKLNTITTYNPTLNFVDSSNIVPALQQTYKSYDKTQRFRDSKYKPSEQKNRLVFILSDGDYDLNPAGMTSEEVKELTDYRKSMSLALGELRKRGMRIYAIGIGSRTGVPLINALKKYKKGYTEDYPPEYEEAIIQRGMSRVYPSILGTLVKETGGDPGHDVLIIDRPDIDSHEFMRRAINFHRQKSQSRTTETRDDEPLWKSVLILAIGLSALSLAGWRVFVLCLAIFYFFGGYIMSHVPVGLWTEMLASFIRSLT